MKKLFILSTSLLTFAIAQVEAATMIQYLSGSSDLTAYNQAAGITGSAITFQGNDVFYTIFGGAGSTPDGPTAGSTYPNNNWMLWRKSAITGPLNATDDYAGFTITLGAPADGITLGDLSFDLAGVRVNNATGGIDVNYQVFAQINGGGFSSVGSASGFTELLPDIGISQFSSVLTGVVDLASLGARSTGDVIDIRIAVRSEDIVGGTNYGLFMQGIKLEDAVTVGPEPSTTALLGIGGLLLIMRRRK